MRESVIKMLELSGQAPIALHIDFVGLFRLGNSNEERLEAFARFLCEAGEAGQGIAIPAFSYSFTKNEPFDVLSTPSQTGFVTEYLRKTGVPHRTLDSIFSYLTYSDKFSKEHFVARDCESFGESGIAGEIYQKDGWMASVGGVFRHCTEIHFLEKLLGVSYRFDKDFDGEIIDDNGGRHKSTVRYFCRKELSLRPDFRRFEEDLNNEGLMQIWQFENPELEIEAVKIRDAHELLKEKIKQDPLYLCVEVDKWIP